VATPSNPAPAIKRASIEELAARGGIAAEHVVLGGSGDEDFQVQRSTAVRQVIALHNPIRQSRVELRIFKDHFMSVIEHRGKRRLPERVIDLKYLDPSPKLSRYIAKKTERLVLMLGAAGTVLLLIAILSLWPIVTGMLALASFAAAGAFAWRYVLRTRDTVEFQTKHGRAVVIALIANIGCMRAYRAAVPDIVAAIRYANGKADGDREAQLRAEVREHYRLAGTGVIAKDVCARATRSILGKF